MHLEDMTKVGKILSDVPILARIKYQLLSCTLPDLLSNWPAKNAIYQRWRQWSYRVKCRIRFRPPLN